MFEAARAVMSLPHGTVKLTNFSIRKQDNYGSNWETVTLCFSESFESLLVGLQNALWQPGGVPEEHRSNSLSVDAVILKLD